jgi:hypothetical protein
VVVVDRENNFVVVWTYWSNGEDVYLKILDVSAPAVPTGFSITNNGTNPVLNWTLNTEKDIAHYEIHRGLSGPGGQRPTLYNKIGQVNRVTATYTDTGVEIGGGWKRAFYKVMAVDNAERGTFSDTAGINISAPSKLATEITAGIVTRPFLSQSYPNPFNPTSTIKYDLLSDSHVSLKVFDVLGRELMTLSEGVQTAGPHQVVLNASELSSGVYFYRLSVLPAAGRDLVPQQGDGKAGDFTETRRLLLLR